MLGADDTLPFRPRRVLVAGLTGSGKSTFAAQLGGVLGLPYTEIDGLHWGPDWVPRPQFVEEVDALVGGGSWITEWQYRVVRERMLARAELLVWLDFPFAVSFSRLLRRTVRRRVRHELLWHGNHEPPLRTFFTAPDDNILRWGLSTRTTLAERIPAVAEAHPELTIVRLRTPAQARDWTLGIVRGRLLSSR